MGPGFSVDDDKYYAELWMGTHPNGPSHLFSSPSTSVLDVIKSNPAHYLGPTLLQKWPSTTHVPFLFKILSIGKALPLQAHPDKSLGEELNRENPREFVDANHKPEIAVAVGEPLGNGNGGGWGEGVVFTGFVGFKPLQEIRDLVQNLPELQRAIGDERLAKAFLDNPTKAALNAIFSSLINRGANSPDLVKKEVLALIGRLEAGPRDILGTGVQATELAKLLVKINAQYPGDVGVFATSFFMNFVKLQKGESVYIGADEIHAYLEGDIIECMAVSDNVLNGAFVPQAQAKQHVPTFLSMLTYTSAPPNYWALPANVYGKSKTGKTRVYAPPVEEFVVLVTQLTKGSDQTERLDAVGGPTIGVVTKGRIAFTVSSSQEKEELDEGGIVYVVPGRDITVELLSGDAGEVWWAANSV